MENLIKKDVELKDHSTFKIGGKADFFAEAHNEEELAGLIEWSRIKNTPFYIIGGGSNILFSDSGFRGIIIKIAGADISVEGENIHAFAGTPLGDIVKESERRGLSGLEWASDIPGSIGGAVRGNAGAYGGQMADVVGSVDVIEPDGTKREYLARDCRFSYRSSIFKEEKGKTITGVTLMLASGNKEEISKKIKDISEQRAKKIPSPGETPNIGSIFKNFSQRPDVDKILVNDPMLYEDCRKKWGNKISVARLVDDLGLKGKKIGGAKVSEKHGNFIVNFRNAKAEDVIILMNLIKERIEQRYDIRPEEEVELVGF